MCGFFFKPCDSLFMKYDHSKLLSIMLCLNKFVEILLNTKHLLIISITIIGTILIIPGCNQKKLNPHELFDMFEHKVNVSTKLILENNEINGYGITFLDTLLLMKIHGSYNYQLYDLKNKRPVKRFGRQGRGPGEYPMLPQFIFQSPEHGNLKVLYRNRLDIYSIDSLIHSGNYLPTSHTIPEGPVFLRASQVNPNTIIGIGLFEKGMYGIIREGEYTGSYIDYPLNEKYNKIEPYLLAIAYQGFIVSHPSDDKCVRAFSNGGVLQFLAISNGTPIITNQIITTLPDIEIMTIAGATSARATSDTRGYRGLAGTPRFVYAIYSDLIPDSRETHIRSMYGKHLLVFDWEGNSLIHFSLDEGISSLFVDKNDEYAYGSTSMGDIVRIPIFLNSRLNQENITK